jgi:hypothetical protein
MQERHFETEPETSPTTLPWSIGGERGAILAAIEALIRRPIDYQGSPKHDGGITQATVGPSKPTTAPSGALSALEEVYVFEERARVGGFVQRNRLRNLLLEARDPLIATFGETAVRKLSVVEDDEGSETLFCSIGVSGSLDEARRALTSFDQGWWLDRCANVSRKLNFDFELI